MDTCTVVIDPRLASDSQLPAKRPLADVCTGSYAKNVTPLETDVRSVRPTLEPTVGGLRYIRDMNFLAWNIRFGGQNRQDLIAAAIVARAPDVVVLTEYQPRGSSQLLNALTSAGLCHHALTDPPPRMGGVAILSRHQLAPRSVPEPLRPYDTRYLAVGIPDAGLELHGLYGLLHEEPFADYWAAVLDALAFDAAGDVLVLGDFNTGEPGLDSPVKRIFCSDFFRELPRRGYVDLWRLTAGRDAREYSWQGRVNPYRLDHAFGSASVAGRLVYCHYSHEERLAGVSDHSLLSVRIDS